MKAEAVGLRDGRSDDWHQKVAARWSIEDVRADPRYRDEWIVFDCLSWDPERRLLYLSLTAIENDILWRLDAVTGKFASLAFTRIGDRFDAKLHRSLERDDDGSYIAATAMLHDVDQQRQALSGKLVRYRPDADELTLLDIPAPSQYIQSMVVDGPRRLVHGFACPAEHMFVDDLETGRSRTVAYVGTSRTIRQPHRAVLDQRGRLWGTWGEMRAFEDDSGQSPIMLLPYDPDADTLEWLRRGPARARPGHAGKADHMLLADDGAIYVGGVGGGWSRIDPDSADVEPHGKPFTGKGLAGPVQRRDGYVYGAGNEAVDRDGGHRPDVSLRVSGNRFDDLGHGVQRATSSGSVVPGTPALTSSAGSPTAPWFNAAPTITTRGGGSAR